jgi:hypothetical protein
VKHNPAGRRLRQAFAVTAGLLLAAVGLPAPTATAGLVTVTDVRVKEFPGKIQVTAVASGSFRHRLTEWAGKPKELVVVDLLGAQLGVPAGELPYRSPVVKAVRVGQFNTTTVRLVVELNRDVSYAVHDVPGAYAVAVTLALGDGPSTNGTRQASGVRETSQSGPRNLQAQRAAPAPRYTLVFRDAKVSDVMAALARLAGVNIVVSPEAGQKTVTLRLVNVTLEEALSFITQPLDLGWSRTGDNVLVMPKDKFPGEPLEIRYYRLQYASAKTVAEQIGPLIFGTQVVVGAPTPAPAGPVPPGAGRSSGAGAGCRTHAVRGDPQVQRGGGRADQHPGGPGHAQRPPAGGGVHPAGGRAARGGGPAVRHPTRKPGGRGQTGPGPRHQG